MSHPICPWWLGYLLASPLRRLFADPVKILSPYVREGMTVLEPGPGMGFFTLELARLAGPNGRVIAVDMQPQMLEGLRHRAARAGMLDRIELRLAGRDSLEVSDLTQIDFVLAFAVVHELPSRGPFFTEVARLLKSGGSLLFAEPKGHVKAPLFNRELQSALDAGLVEAGPPVIRGSHAVLLVKP